jgi:hypothetical protein
MRDELGNSLAQLLVVATWLGRSCAERWNGVALQWRHTVVSEQRRRVSGFTRVREMMESRAGDRKTEQIIFFITSGSGG